MQNQKAIKLYDEGRKFQQQAKHSAAERAYRKALKINPDFVEALNNLGNVLVDQDRLKEAAEAYRKALKLLPDHAMLLNNLGNALQLQGENELAIEWFEKALAQDPGYADAYSNLGNALKDMDDLDKAIKSYRTAIKLDIVNKEAYNGLGIALNIQGKYNEAITAYRKAIEIDPRHREAYRNLGSTMSDIGNFEQAIYWYRKVIEIQPDDADTYRLLSVCKKFSEGDEDLFNMKMLFDKNGISHKQKMNLAYGLGKAYEDLQNYDESIKMIILANRIKRKSVEFSIDNETALFNEIKLSFSDDFNSPLRDFGCPDPSPIFILGMPRSGTSLVEQILASHPEIHGAGELSLLSKLVRGDSNKSAANTFYEITKMESDKLRRLGEEYITEIRNYNSSTMYITDKMPHNFLWIGIIKIILPNARIIHCSRNPMDNCLSLYKNYLIKGHPYSFDMVELGRYYRLYQDLMKHWQVFYTDSIFQLSYETLVTNQEKETRRLLEYCDLPWNDACLHFHETKRRVKTASNAQVRKPIYTDSIDIWKHYEKHLLPLYRSIYSIQ